jgi:hypothetical protein
MAGQFMIFYWNVRPVNEQKVDEMHVIPANANAM